MRNRCGLALLTTVTAVLISAAGCGRKPPAVEHDLSNPKSAAIVFAKALEAGDAEEAKYAALASGLEIDLVDAMAGAALGMKKLVEASEAKFGPEGRSALSPRDPLVMAPALLEAEVTINGKLATVKPTNSASAIPLKLIEDEWKVDIGAFTRGSEITHLVRYLKTIAVTAPKLTEQVRSGKFTSAIDVRSAMEEVVLAEMLGTAARTPFPATAPTTAPDDDQS